ncbi:MAG: response regulator transcription factor [Alphaproteobacteria bacterium]|nr:response regulator transcription factor [Alphaproteobacteria bacterium]
MTSATEPIIDVIDADPVSRRAIVALLDTVAIRAREFATAAEALAVIGPGQPGCIVAAIDLPSMSGVDLQGRLRAMGAAQPVILLVGHAEVAATVAAFKAGAFEVIAKPFADQALIEAVQRAIALDARLRHDLTARSDYLGRIDKLTARERDVFALLLNGLTNHKIGERLGITRKTVEIHRLRVMRKLRAKNFAELVQTAAVHLRDDNRVPPPASAGKPLAGGQRSRSRIET